MEHANFTNSMIYASVYASIISQITKLLEDFIRFCFGWVRQTNITIKKTFKYYINITGRFKHSSEYYFPYRFYACCYKIRKNKIKLQNIELFILSEEDHKNVFFTNDFTNDYLIEENIYVSFNQSINDRDTSSNYPLKILTMQIKSDIYTSQELIEIIDKWYDKYNTEIKNKNDLNRQKYIFSLNNIKHTFDNTNVNSNITFSIEKFNYISTFKNIFFTEKDNMLKRLDFFVNNREFYVEKGWPHTFGLLLHGSPGCGKTSCIRAIAEYTKRHIVMVDMSKIKTCDDFKKIYLDDFYGGIDTSFNKKIIVFEDIDCMNDIVLQRNEKLDNMSFTSSLSLNLNDDKNKDKDIEFRNKLLFEQKDLTLSYILNLLDGINVHNGRILIITTNMPEKLDKALIRPGRINMKINFTKCTKLMYKQIIEHYYGKIITQDINFIEYKHSPAELIDMCHMYEMNKLLEEIVK